MQALDQMSDATAHAVYVLAKSTKAVNGQGKGHTANGMAKSGLARSDAHGVRLQPLTAGTRRRLAAPAGSVRTVMWRAVRVPTAGDC